jgi:hypothetical protein
MRNESFWRPIQDQTTVIDVLKMAALLISVLMGLIGSMAYMMSGLPGNSHWWPW